MYIYIVNILTRIFKSLKSAQYEKVKHIHLFEIKTQRYMKIHSTVPFLKFSKPGRAEIKYKTISVIFERQITS